MDTVNSNKYGRRRSIVKRRTELAKANEKQVESALKRGFCPRCNTRIGRGVRKHYEFCGE